MDPIKEAFGKIKSDISSLKDELKSLKSDIFILKEFISNIPTNQQTNIQTHNPTNPTHNHEENNQQTNIQTHNQTIPSHNYAIEAPYESNFDISIGNDGVPTDKPTNQQTNIQTHNPTNLLINNEFKEVNNILETLDNAKKGIRLKFKRLTKQEMLVFSHLYELQEQNYDEITYRVIAKKMGLSESSIRDYINKLTSKGIPIEKIRQNNKTILLKISQDLKNIANLATIQNLREL